jgi:preprotein translocase subunit Sec61beta
MGGCELSKKTKKDREAGPMPAASAGLLRFYEEETPSGIKFLPEVVIALAIVLVLAVVLANIWASGSLAPS